MATAPKPITVLAWYPHIPATETAILAMANSRQLALRTRLRNHYWLTECKALTAQTIELTRSYMAMIDPTDAMPQEQVNTVLSEHYGFVSTPEGLTIPDLDAARGDVLASVAANKLRASAGGRAKAARAALASESPNPSVSGFGKPEPADF